MRNKHIFFCVRKNFLEASGGDTDQALTWKAVLEQLGNHVTILYGNVKEEDLREADCVFIWHLERPHESFPQFLAAKRARKSVFLVPTCYHEPGGLTAGKIMREQLAQWVRALLLFPGETSGILFRHLWKDARKAMLCGSERILVNSQSEADLLISEGADPAKVLCIPNVIREAEIGAVERKAWKERSGIVCIGHFCPRKNQLALIEALAGTDLTVTFAGTARPMHRAYFRYCRKKAGAQHHFPGRLPHKEVLELLAGARLCVCASRVETPGISNLEAGALGCKLLLPKIPPIEEYFQSFADYFDPDHIDSAVIVEAAEKEPSPQLRERIGELYTERSVRKIFDSLQILAPPPVQKDPLPETEGENVR